MNFQTIKLLFTFWVCILASFSVETVIAGELFRYVDEHGVTRFTDRPPPTKTVSNYDRRTQEEELIDRAVQHGRDPKFDEGLLWEIRRPGRNERNYVFGTMHRGLRPLVEFVSNDKLGAGYALRNSTTLCLEILPGESAVRALVEHAIGPRGFDLRYVIPTDEVAEVMRATRRANIPDSVALRLQPWFLMMVVSENEMPSDSSYTTVESVLLDHAEKLEKKTCSAEDPAEHFRSLSSFSMEEQAVLLRGTLQEIRRSDKPDVLATYFQEKTLQLVEQDRSQSELSEQERNLLVRLDDKVLVKRNAKIVIGQIENFNRGGVFLAVGAAHLPGVVGVLNMLKSSGFELRRIAVPSVDLQLYRNGAASNMVKEQKK